MIQRFDVGQRDIELEAFAIDAAVHHRVEHEAVVRARRERQRQLHTDSNSFTDCSPSASMAASICHAPRFRRTTALDTARTCANGTPAIKLEYMNAAPSIDSTSGS